MLLELLFRQKKFDSDSGLHSIKKLVFNELEDLTRTPRRLTSEDKSVPELEVKFSSGISGSAPVQLSSSSWETSQRSKL